MLTPIGGYTAAGRGTAARRAGPGFALPEAERAPESAADPALRDILRAISLRARIELARSSAGSG